MAVTHRASATATTSNPVTTFIITIPASIAVDDDLYCLVSSFAHTSSDAFVTVVDNDTGGNTWTRIGSITSRRLNLFWKKATSATASKTITVAGGVSGLTGGMSGFDGAAAGDPTTDIAFEENASGNESHAGFTPANADSMICLGIGNDVDDAAGFDVTVAACTDPGTLEPELWVRGSSGGGDGQATLFAVAQTGGPTATGTFTWSQATNSTSQSVVFAIKPAVAAVNEMAAAPAGVTTITAWLESAKRLIAAPVGTSTIAANLQQIIALRSAPIGVATVAANLTEIESLNATIAGTSTVAANLSILTELAATSTGTSTVAAGLGVSVELAATIVGTSAITANLGQTIALRGSPAGTSTIAAHLTTVVHLAAVIAGTSTMTPSHYRGQADLFPTGPSGGYVATPDHADFDVTNGLTFTTHIALDDWEFTGGTQVIAYRGDADENFQTFNFWYNTDFFLDWNDWTLTAATDLGVNGWGPDGEPGPGDSRWVRFTLNPDNGSGESIVSFYISADGVTWHQLATYPNPQADMPLQAAGIVNLGAWATASTTGYNNLAGKIYYAEFRNHYVGGTIIANPDFRVPGDSLTQFTDSTGKVWTFSGNAHWIDGGANATQINASRATVAGTSTVTAYLTAITHLASAPAGLSTIAARLSQVQPLQSVIGGSSTITADLQQIVAHRATIAGTSSLTTALTQIHDARVAVAGSSTITAALTNQGANVFATVIAGIGTAAANLTLIHDLRSTSTGLSTIAAALQLAYNLFSTTTGLSTATASANQIHQARTAIVGSSLVTAALTNQGVNGFTGSPAGIATIAAHLVLTHQLSATPTGSSTVSAGLITAVEPLTAPAGTSFVAANLTQIQYFSSAPAGVAFMVAEVVQVGLRGRVTSALATVGAVTTTDQRIGSVAMSTQKVWNNPTVQRGRGDVAIGDTLTESIITVTDD